MSCNAGGVTTTVAAARIQDVKTLSIAPQLYHRSTRSPKIYQYASHAVKVPFTTIMLRRMRLMVTSTVVVQSTRKRRLIPSLFGRSISKTFVPSLQSRFGVALRPHLAARVAMALFKSSYLFGLLRPKTHLMMTRAACRMLCTVEVNY